MGDFEYIEEGGLLYPNIDTGFDELSQLEKYGKMRLKYIHDQKPALYRELLFTQAQMVADEVVRFQMVEV